VICNSRSMILNFICLRVKGKGFRVWGLEYIFVFLLFLMYGLGFWVRGCSSRRVRGQGPEVKGVGFRVRDLAFEFRVQGIVFNV